MSPGQFRITVHSGPKFKHRKAFVKAKEWQRKYFKTDKTDFVISNQKRQLLRTALRDRQRFANAMPRINLIVILFVLILFVLGAKIGNHFILMMNSTPSYTTFVEVNKRKAEEKANKNAYQVLTNSGEAYLRANQLDAAQREFNLAIATDRYGKAANIGLTKTLVQQCLQLEKNCKEAKMYIAYIQTSKLLEKGELEKFNQLFNEVD